MLPVWKPCLIQAEEILAKQRKHSTPGFHRYWKINLLAIVELHIVYGSASYTLAHSFVGISQL